MNKQKINTSLAVIIALIVVGGFFGIQKLFMNPTTNQNYNPDQNKLGLFVNIETPTPTGDPEKVNEAIFLGGLSEFDQALMVDDQKLRNDYENIINSTSEIYENEI